ncbi:MAG TPA: hypothetical protein VM537_17130 [Anaerolineae bacterium]|nr:hypothetical protein [Anaerolineae bacterium]
MIDIQMSAELNYALALLKYILYLCSFGFCCLGVGIIVERGQKKLAFALLVMSTLFAALTLPTLSWKLTRWYAILAELRGW